MSLFFKTRDGQTPIEPSIIKELKHKHVNDMSELYELESENIAQGIVWSQSTNKDHLDYTVWLELHKQMLKNVWKFAGIIRTTELANSDFHSPFDVRPALLELEKDLKTWLEHKTYDPKEMMAMFHERLLTIHPFKDGNGRWSRVLTEFVCARSGMERPTWGSKTIADDKARRDQYIEAIKIARHELNYEKLIAVMWS
jgi:Fic-DOC domain mobile mystery protein B